MQSLIQTIILGLGPGALEGIMAIGIVLIFRTGGVINFSLGATGTVGCFVAYSAAQGRPLLVAVLVGCLVGAAAGGASYVIVSGVRSRHVALAAAVATLAIAILLDQIVRALWSTPGPFPSAFSPTLVTAGPWQIPPLYVAAILAGCILVVLIQAWLKWSRIGTMVRAVADQPSAARLSGANVPLILGGIWAPAGALAVVSGFFQSQITFDYTYLDPVFLGALIAAVLAGLRSVPLAYAGGIALEVTRTLYQTYVVNISSDLAGYAQTFVLLLLVAALLIAPRRWLTHAGGRTV